MLKVICDNKKIINSQSNRMILLIFLSCFSYPITSVLFLTFSIPSEFGNIILKSLFLAYYIHCLLKILKCKNLSNKNTIYIWFVYIFFILYSFRLMYDIGICNIRMAFYSTSYVLLYFFALTLLPVFVLSMNRKNLNIANLSKYIFYFLVLANIGYFSYSMFISTGNLEQQFAGRINVESKTNADLAVINPITLGLYGVCLIIFILAKLTIQDKINSITKFAFLLLITLGGVNMLLSASRGPFLVLVLLIFVNFVFYIHKNIKKPYFVFYLLFFIISSTILITYILIPYFSDKEVFLFHRLETIFDFFDSKNKEARNYSYEGAFNDFLNSPILGNHFVGSYDNFYPHNMILEVAMSLGLLGLIIFLGIVGVVIRNFVYVLKNSINNEVLPVMMVGFCFILISMTSGSIISNPEFWIFFTLLSFINETRIENQFS